MQQVLGGERHLDAIGLRVQGHGRLAEGIDVRAQGLGRAGLHRRDRHQARAGGEVDHPLAGHLLGMVEQIARQGLAAGPGEGPERRLDALRLQRFLGLAPDRFDLAGQVELDLGRVGRALQPGVPEDEGLGIGDHPPRPK